MADISSSVETQRIINVLDSIVDDISALDTALDTLAAKLNLDAGVTDVDYAGAAPMITTK